MARLSWTDLPPTYELGVDFGTYFPRFGDPEPWIGLARIEELPQERGASARYLDGIHLSTSRPPGDFAGRIDAYAYPRTLQASVLGPRGSIPFNFSYRTKTERSYKTHLVYNARLSPTGHIYDQEDPTAFSWDFTTTPVGVPGAVPTAHLIVESAVAHPWTTVAFEDFLYGTETTAPRFPSPSEVLEIFEENSILRVIDHGDGSWSAIGPANVVSMSDDTSFVIDYPTAVYISPDTYQVSSL